MIKARTIGINGLRKAVNLICRTFRGPSLGVATSDLPVADTWARLYVPPKVTPDHPLILFVHGGGFVCCGLDTNDALCRRLAVSAESRVLALGYPLAPEASAPAQLDAVLGACREVAGGSVPALGPRGRLWLAGDSAGGYLALKAAVDLNGAVERLLLFYPMVHLEADRWKAPWWNLTRKAAEWGVASIRKCLGPHRYPPLTTDELERLPPTTMVYGGILDPVAHEARRLAGELRQAGVTVVEHRHAGMAHGALCVPVLYPWGRGVIGEAVVE